MIKLGHDVKNDWYEVKKIVDTEKYLFIGKGLRGEISYIAKRIAKANSKYMKNYDPKYCQNIYRTLIGIICMFGQ